MTSDSNDGKRAEKREKSAHKKAEPTFEQALHRLDEIVARLEQGEESLGAAVSLFEEGMKLFEMCEQRLKEARGKIEKLVESAEGARAEPMRPDELRGQ
jgi:exodeoxyribonuclease VII small subunit